MSRYTVNYDSSVFGQIEPLPKGTSRKDGMTFVEAKKELVDWLMKNRDAYAAAAMAARKITRTDAKAGPPPMIVAAERVTQDEEE